ncbi:MAG: Maf family protein, partial [Flavobacteriia bacterium]
MRLVLGSASPRRQALLSELGFEFRVLTADADESFDPA